MLDAFAYPVSGIMKLWHLLLHNALGLEEQTAWFFAIIGLVITVRGLLLPFFWFRHDQNPSVPGDEPQGSDISPILCSSTALPYS